MKATPCTGCQTRASNPSEHQCAYGVEYGGHHVVLFQAEPIPYRAKPGTCPACGSESHVEPLASCIRD